MIKDRFIVLIDRYLSGTATESEEQLVEAYLERLEAEDNTMHTAKPHVKEAMWRQIQEQTVQEEVLIIQTAWYNKRLLRIIAVAASVICVVGLCLLFGNNKNKQADKTFLQNSRNTDSIPSLVRHIVNTSGKDESIQLPDGSMIILESKSEITYQEPFINKRDITLIGKASFKVAKNKTKPFTVVSRAVSTTALGTDFTVVAYVKASQLTVRLYEGKVVVKANDKDDKRMKKDFYLLPGQEFIYSEQTLARVRTFKTKSTVSKDDINDDLVGNATSLPQNATGSWHMFNNQSLGLVFNQLAELYDVKIIYNKQDVRRKYFVGRFNKSDSLATILKYITIANRLTFSKKDDVYYINN